MYKKRTWYVLLIILLLIVTNVATLVISNGISIAIGDKVIVDTDSSDTANYITKLLLLKDEIEKNYYKDVDQDALLDGAISGMFKSVGDPYTTYYDEDQFQTYMEQIQGSYVGIGIVVSMDDNENVRVVSSIDGSPGEKAGLISGDKIIEVDGEDISGLSLEEVVGKIKGDQGSKVLLTLEREGNSFQKKIERQEIVMESVNSITLEDNIGYISISQFESYTTGEFEEHLNSLLNKGIEGLILDVRDNPGGMMDSVVKIVDRLIGESIIVYTEDKEGKREYMKSDEKTKVDLPMVVLINEGSASASEIFAGALKDSNYATVVGATSFGKGVVQRMSEMGDGTGYKITVSEYFTPSGKNIHDKGIEPDIEVSMPDTAEKGDLQLQRAVEVIKEKIGQ